MPQTRYIEYVKHTIIKFVTDKNFIRYVVSGVSSLAADYGTFLLSYYAFGITLRLAVPLGLFIGLVVSFTMNKLWAFNAKSGAEHHHPSHVQGLLFLVLVALNALFTYYFVKLLLSYSVPASIGKMIAVGLTVVWNYFLYKKIIFKPKFATDH